MKKLRIGILTFHRSVNYGAVTQCYALVNRIQNDFPDDIVEVIDYVPKFRIKHYDPSLFNYLFGSLSRKQNFFLNIRRLMSKLFELLIHPSFYRKNKNRFKVFQESLTCLPLSKERCISDSVEDFHQFIKGKYDIIVVGSDCVWEWSTVPIPNAYYLQGDIKAKKMSFAASAGVDDYRLLSNEQQNYLQTSISDFVYIGLRDTSVEFNVSGLCPGLHFYHNCDPTTLLDPALLSTYRENAKKKLIIKGVDFSRPIVCIMGNDKIAKTACSIFGDAVQYVGVYAVNNYSDFFIDDFTVLEWASSFALYNITFTTFFHGTMLSLVNSTPVLSFDYLPETSSHITKLHELYTRLNLPGFYHRWKDNYNDTELTEIKQTAIRLFQNPPKNMIQMELKKEASYYDSFYQALYALHSDEK